MKTMKKIVCALMTLVLLLSSVPAVFADEADTNPIDQDAACSLTIWKFDYTNAKKDGVWDEDTFPSTGWQESYVENALINTNRKGDTDGQNGNALGNGQTSKGYAIAGVEFTYLKVADITTFQNQETTQVLYGFHKTDAANLLKAIGLENGANRCAEADSLDADRCFYTSDTLNKALSQSLEANSTTVKNALETFIRNGGTAMDPTNEVGKTSAKNLPVGLYLLVETKVPEMVTSTTNPFFVSLPMTTVTGNDNSASQNGGAAWNYDVVVYPKQETGIPTLEKTVREAKADTGKNEGSASITDGFAHTATGSAGDTMEYQIVSTLPTITSQATALSTYNFYDTLCEGLAYDKDTLQSRFQYDFDGPFGNCIETLSQQLAEEAAGDYLPDLLNNKQDSFLEELDDGSVARWFKESVSESVRYMVLHRCGYAPELDNDVFGRIQDFNTEITASLLGSAVSTLSESILREIGIIVKSLERQQSRTFDSFGDTVYNEARKNELERSQNNGTDLHNAGGLPAAQPDSPGKSQGGQVRDATAQLSAQAPGGAVHRDADEGNPERPSGGSGPGGQPDAGTADNADDPGAGRDGGTENPGSDAVGAADEQHPAGSRGDHLQSANLHVIEESPLPSVEEQISFLDGGFSVSETAQQTLFPQLQLPQQIIDEALCMGFNDRDSRKIICAYFMKDKPDNAAFLQESYGTNGAGLIIQGQEYAVWYDPEGIRISTGRTVKKLHTSLVTWEQAAKRIRELLDMGRYMPQAELDQVPDFERRRLAQSLTFAVRECSAQAKEDGYLPLTMETYSSNKGFPEIEAQMQRLLESPDTLTQLAEEWAVFAAAHANDRSLMVSRLYHPAKLLQKLEDLQRIPLTFTAAEGFNPLRRYFISDDELNQALRGHEREFRTRLDVFSFFSQNTDTKEREQFLKRQHGEYSGYHGGNDNKTYTSAGFSFSHGDLTAPYAQLNMKWPAVTKWVSNMISSGTYLYPSDTDKMADYEINQLARRIMSFFSNTPDGFQRPTPRSDFDYWEGVTEIQEQLSDPEQVNTIYFVSHPEMVLGQMQEVSGPYGMETACIPQKGQSLEQLLSVAIRNIHGEIQNVDLDDLPIEEADTLPADPSVRNFSFAVVDGKLYFRENSRMDPVSVSATAEQRIRGLIGIRDCVRKLIEYQTEDYPEAMIQEAQARLNALYDSFVEKYGRINSRANSTAFSSDNAYYLLSSLEVRDSEGKFLRKADMFSKRTIRQRVTVTSVDTASEALALSLAEKAKVDMPYMVELTHKREEEILSDLKGVIFLNPEHDGNEDVAHKYLPADEYLSGNVREKLRTARAFAETDEGYTVNVQSLEAVQPVDLTASEISVRLGAAWLPTEVVRDFTFELLRTPYYQRRNIKVHYSTYTGEWNIDGKSLDRGNVRSENTFGTERINAYKIIEETLNLRDVRIFDYEYDDSGKKVAILNTKQTAIAQGKQEQIKQEFADWIWADPNRRERLTTLYNEKFNSIRPREYDGSHLNFVGINPEITLRPHQVNAIAHILYGGNTLLAHVVGAGKSATRS